MRYLFIFLLTLGGVITHSFAQDRPLMQAQQDTLRDFEIIRGPSMRMIKTDTGTLQTLAGGAVVKQDGTIFSSDSMVLNVTTRRMNAYGNIHINDGDSVHIYAGNLTYSGETKSAVLRNNVRVIGQKGNLTTQELDYNISQGIGNYYRGGKVVNNENVITSSEGTYYADTKDVYFKRNVKMDGPKNHIRTDTLVYNMNNAVLTFATYTYLWNDEIEVGTTKGSYNTDTGDAFFTERSSVTDTTGRIFTADLMALEGTTENIQMEGNGVVIDSAGGFSLLSNQIFIDKKNNSALATRMPLLILTKGEDSTYVAADTIFTALAKMIDEKLFFTNDTATALAAQQGERIDYFRTDSNENYIITEFVTDSLDTLLRKSTGTIKDTLVVFDSVAVTDSLKISDFPPPPDLLQQKKILEDSAAAKTEISNLLNRKPMDTIPPLDKKLKGEDELRDTSRLAPPNRLQPDSIVIPTVVDSSSHVDDSTRYFMAFHNVRIYNDSLQSVCDSLFLSTKDSVFRMYGEPVVWNKNTQVTGDTMFLFTRNQKADRLFVFDRSIVINQTEEGFFNQLEGKTLNAYFVDEQFDYIRVKGSPAESVFYLQDEDSSYLGMNRTSGDAVDMTFEKGELEKVIYINQVRGKVYPMSQIPEDQKRLKSFQWLDNRRPKNKADLFR